MTTTLSAGTESAGQVAASPRRTVALTAAGVVVAGAATSIVALTVTALGAADGFAPLRPALYLPFVAIGVVASVIGWRIIR